MEAIEAFKARILTEAHAAYNFKDIQGAPVNFEQIKNFCATNSQKCCVSIMGLSRKVQKGQKTNRYKQYRTWPIFQTPNFLQRSLSDPDSAIYLLITSEISDQPEEPDQYHVSLIKNFQWFMTEVNHGRIKSNQRSKYYFCPTCLQQIPHEGIERHAEHCHSYGSSSTTTPHIEFYPPGYDTRFRVRLNATNLSILGCMDLETARIKSPDEKLFGDMSQCLYQLTPISFASYIMLNHGIENLPSLTPKAYIGSQVMLNYFKTLHLELTFLQSWVKKTYYPLHTDLDVEELKEQATNCANCKLPFRDRSMKHLHHNHLREKFNFRVFFLNYNF